MYHTSQPEQFPSFAPPSSLTISEVVANGAVSGITDPAEPTERAAWLEIYNSSTSPIELGGFKLAHALFFPHDYVIPAGVIVPANGYVVFLLDDDPEQGPLHAAFKPVRAGDTIGLYTPHGILVDEVTYGPELEKGGTLALISDGATSKWMLACATPGRENQANCNIYLPVIVR